MYTIPIGSMYGIYIIYYLNLLDSLWYDGEGEPDLQYLVNA